MLQRQKHWHLSINATFAHDTKHGKDVRAMLNVLTDLPSEQIQKITEWQELAKDLKQDGFLDSNDEYFTLVLFIKL